MPHLIPFHGVLEGLHGKVDLADVLVLHKDTQSNFAARHGGEGVLAVRQVPRNQRKQVAGLDKWILPNSIMPAVNMMILTPNPTK